MHRLYKIKTNQIISGHSHAAWLHGQITQDQEGVWWLSPGSLSASCFTEKSHLLVFGSASCEKKVFSPTERWIEKCSVATHVSAGPYRGAKHLSPRPSEGLWGFVCVWSAAAVERGSMGEGLFIVLASGPSQKSFFFYPGQRAPLLRAQGEKRRNVQEIFYWKPGLACLTLEERGRSAPLFLSGNLGINQGLFLLARHHFKILPESWKSLWGFSFVVWVLLEGLSLQTGYLVSSWVTNPYFCYRPLTEMTSFSSTVAAWYFTGVASGDLKAMM